MPSDDPRVRQALDALARPIAEFRTAVRGALAQAESWLSHAAADPPARAAQGAAELGAFAAGRVRPEAFAALSSPPAPPEPAPLHAIERAIEILQQVSGRDEALFFAEVPSGGSLGSVVATALAEAGRAFGAVMVAELVRGGRYTPDQHDRLLGPLAFRDWNSAERRFAPPLVVAVDGADLHAAALADFCDGRAKLLLVVRGPSGPAALVRLITPGTLVLQTADGTGLDRVVAYEGPSVAALMPEDAARFLHDPAGGREPWQRLTVAHLPTPDPPRRALGGQSGWQMAEDLRQLTMLAQTPFVIPDGRGSSAAPAVGGADAVDRLAAWLLNSADPPAA